MAVLVTKILIFVAILSVCALVMPRVVTTLYARSRSFQVDRSPTRRVAVIFGAGLWRDGTPTTVLRDRITTAAELYFAGKVEKLLMSGDNRFVYYNEPGAMRDYALTLGVPSEDIVMDFAGRRTYDTCFRAQAIFGLDEPILVTQQFHLPRAIFTCNALGLPAIGVPADRRVYRRRSTVFWNIRENLATLTAFWDLYISHPTPVLGDPEPIFPARTSHR